MSQNTVLLAACVVCLLITVCAEKRMIRFKSSGCAPDKSLETFSIPEVHIQPDPVLIPGNLTAWGYVHINQSVIGNVSLQVKIQRYLFNFFWFTIPCIKNVGSCTYHDVCQLLLNNYNATTGCSESLKAQGIPCICPFLPGTYTMHRQLFPIHKLKGLWTALATGDYKVDLTLRDTITNVVIGCQHLELSLAKGVVPPKLVG